MYAMLFEPQVDSFVEYVGRHRTLDLERSQK